MISSLLNDTAIDTIERTVNFTEQRHTLILENLANVSTPGYVQKDVSVQDFRDSLAAAIQRQRESFNSPFDPKSTDTTEFQGVNGDSGVRVKARPVVTSAPFHDRGIRSMENLMGQLADNAEAHNMAAQFLRSRYDQINRAISMKP